ncbi:MAG: transglutaminase-like domain-containing protein [Chitinophagaceae bacterium]
MNIGRIHSNRKLFAQLVLLGIPTIFLAFYVLKQGNDFYAILQNDWIKQTIYFGSGLLAALFFYAFRFRFITTAAVLIGVLYTGYKIIGNVSLGEFDAFFVSIKFFLFAFLFSLGWFTGFGFSRARYYTIGWSVFLLAAMILVVSHIPEVKASTIITTFVPTLAYSFYIIYMSELIRNMNEDEPSFAWYIMKRFLAFAVVAGMIIAGLLFWFNKDFEGVEKEWGGGGKAKEGQGSGGNKLTKQDKDGGVSTSNSMGLDGSNQNDKNKQKRLLFVSKLDNYFNDGKSPNPLYYITNYFTKFDLETQQFEIDSAMPYNDHFNPDPSKTRLFFTKTDTSVLRNMLATKMRKTIDAEVYKVMLSNKSFTAPATAFFVQPITVPKEDSGKYNSAYRAKMNVSALNSAYFVYNPAGNKELEKFQEERFAELRSVKDYAGVPADFMKYYTFMPRSAEFDSIGVLARQIVSKSGAKSYVDQIVALRSYFLSKDENGLPNYSYTDNPGVPGMPSANKLTYFLFQTKKGYCAYYAGATLFLLRALGIPSRVATGFLTVDRSAKNPGWYFFYEDQAHAWVQCYFPGYGWIDFDTTVPNRDQQEAPQPDETPPLTMERAWLVANGKVETIDTAKKLMRISMSKMVYWDDPYELTHNVPVTLDVKIAKFTKDTGVAALSDVKIGNEVVAISYAEAFKKLPPREDDSAMGIIKRFPDPAPVDEVKIMSDDEVKKDEVKKEEPSIPFNWQRTFWITLGSIGFLLLLVFALPWLIFRYLHAKATSGNGDLKQQAYNKFMAATYYLNQVGYNRGEGTTLQFARDVVDPTFKTQFTAFMNTYLKTKYSSQPLDGYDEKIINAFYPKIWQDVKGQLPAKTRFPRFLNIFRTIQFFVKPKLK